jgi:hypothetical protein
LTAAVHGHPAAVVTLKDPGPPDAGSVWLPGAIENVQPAACVTVKGWLATVVVPWRGAPVFCAITS